MEGSAKGHPVMAGFFERFVALFIDSFIVSVGAYLILIPFAILGGGMSALFGNAYEGGDVAGFGFIMLGYIFMIAFTLGYYVYFLTKNGQTLGKKVMNIKVVRTQDLSYMSWGRVLLREIIGRWISSLLFGLGYFWYFSSTKRQVWHDSISDTYVVKTDPTGKILTDGPSLYPQEYVKTFLPCGCITLFYGAIIFFVILLASIGMQSEAENAQKAKQKYDDRNMQFEDALEDPEEFDQLMKEFNKNLEENGLQTQ